MTQRIQSLGQKLGRLPAGWWVILLVLPALVPMARGGFFESHDGLFHAYRLDALDRAVRAGVLYPRWFPEFAFGYGHPVLNFYGPLSYYWGLPFTLLGADALLGIKLVFASGLIASGLAMYLFARTYMGRAPALVSAVFYAYVPYHLLDVYLRGALAEFLAFVWFPLVLWAFHRVVRTAPVGRLGRMALAALLLAALIVTHNLSALILAPVLVAYLALLLTQASSRGTAGAVAAALLLPVALTAFYWLPILAETQYVGLSSGISQGYRDHFLTPGDFFSFDPAYPHPAEVGALPAFPLGLAQIAVLIAAPFLAIFGKDRRRIVIFFLIVGLLAAFMLTTLSEPIWRLLEPVLAYLQYPARFHALAALATAFLAGALCAAVCQALQAAPRWPLALGFCLLVGVWALWRLSPTPAAPALSVEAMWQRDQDLGQVGATWTGEYLPIWVQEQRWALSRPQPEQAAGLTSLPAGQVRLDGVGYTSGHMTVDAPQGTTVTLHQFHFPGWQARWQGENIPSQPEGPLALATFDLPAGQGPLEVRLASTPAQLWGTVISLISLSVVGITALVGMHPEPRAPRRRSILLGSCYLAVAAVLLISLVWPNGIAQAVTPVGANLEDAVEVIAFSTDDGSYRPGERIAVTLYWRALRSLDKDYKAFVHLTGADVTRQPAQHDGDPGAGFTPTTRWLPGEIVPDTHRLALPSDLAPGTYRLWAGMYDYETVKNLEVLGSGTTAVDGRVLLGEVEVVAP